MARFVGYTPPHQGPRQRRALGGEQPPAGPRAPGRAPRRTWPVGAGRWAAARRPVRDRLASWRSAALEARSRGAGQSRFASWRPGLWSGRRCPPAGLGPGQRCPPGPPGRHSPAGGHQLAALSPVGGILTSWQALWPVGGILASWQTFASWRHFGQLAAVSPVGTRGTPRRGCGRGGGAPRADIRQLAAGAPARSPGGPGLGGWAGAQARASRQLAAARPRDVQPKISKSPRMSIWV